MISIGGTVAVVACSQMYPTLLSPSAEVRLRFFFCLFLCIISAVVAGYVASLFSLVITSVHSIEYFKLMLVVDGEVSWGFYDYKCLLFNILIYHLITILTNFL
eukprot:Rmarinus@m.22812